MRLMLAITNRCNKTCSHCCFSSSPEDKRGLTLEEICEYIDEAASLSAVTSGQEKLHVRFTGGEPFLRFDDLLEAVSYAKKRGAERIGCTSNGYWAASFSEAGRKLSELKNAGLDDIRLSCDEFHESPESIGILRNAFTAAVEANLSPGLKIVVHQGSLRAADILRLLGDVTRDIIFHIEELSLLPVGRARELPGKMLFKSKGLPTNTWCDLLQTFVVDVEKNVWPCCSPGQPELLKLSKPGIPGPGLLSALIEDARNNPLFNALAIKGPVFFIPFLEKAGLVFPPGNYVNRCHLCQELLHAADKNDAARDALKEATAAWESEQTRLETVLGIVHDFLTSSP